MCSSRSPLGLRGRAAPAESLARPSGAGDELGVDPGLLISPGARLLPPGMSPPPVATAGGRTPRTTLGLPPLELPGDEAGVVDGVTGLALPLLTLRSARRLHPCGESIATHRAPHEGAADVVGDGACAYHLVRSPVPIPS